MRGAAAQTAPRPALHQLRAKSSLRHRRQSQQFAQSHGQQAKPALRAAKEGLGPDFCVSEPVLEAIVGAAGIQAGDYVLEIGPGALRVRAWYLKRCMQDRRSSGGAAVPGTGNLTRHLLSRRPALLVAVEKDDALAADLGRDLAQARPARRQCRLCWRSGHLLGARLAGVRGFACRGLQDARVRVVHADALRANLRELTALLPRPAKVVANVPFNITTGDAPGLARRCEPVAGTQAPC